MTFRRTIERTWEENLLFSVLLELTYRCNLDCVFCYNDLGLQGQPLRKEQYFDLFEDLRELDVLNLTLSGGEPLAHPDFLELGRAARNLGFLLRVKSNGHALRGKLARRLKEEVDPFLVEVSLHGARPQTHDRQTRVPGSFERLIENLREMRQIGLRFKINSTLTRWNEGEIGDMSALARELGAPLSIDPTVTPKDNGDLSPLALSASVEGLRKLHQIGRPDDQATDPMCTDQAATGVTSDRAATEAGSSGAAAKNCGSGSNSLTVDPFGNVYPCVQWRRRLGNLHRNSVISIWQDSPVLREVRRLNRQAGAMAIDQGIGSFCMGLAEQETGDPLGRYAAIERRERAVDSARQAAAARPTLPIVG